MKKISVLLIVFVSFIIFANDVNAVFAPGVVVTKSGHNRNDSVPGLVVRDSLNENNDIGSYSYQNGWYTWNYVLDIEGSGYSAFCLDPNKAGGTSNYIGQQLLAGDRATGKIGAYDTAMLYILEYGQRNGTSHPLPEYLNQYGDNAQLYYYMATLIAMRAITYGFGYSDDLSGFDTESPSAYTNLAVMWNANNSEINSMVNEMTDENGKYMQPENGKYLSNYKTSISFYAEPGTAGTDILNAAATLYKDAISAAYNFYKGNHSDTGSTTLTTYQNTAKVDDSTVHTITFKTQNANEDTRFTNLAISLSNYDSAKMKIEKAAIYVDGVEVKSRTDISTVQHLNDLFYTFVLDNRKITDESEVKIVLTVKPLVDECEALGYNFDIKYTGGAALGIGYLTKSKSSSYQRYIFYVPNAEGAGESYSVLKGDIPVCDNTLIDESEVCPTDMNVVPDCLELGEYEASNDDLDFYIDGPEDILSCIIENEDDTGKPYQAEACDYDGVDNGITVDDNNPYCSVSCKEDYTTLRFPGIQEAAAGRYFKIGATVTGTKTCYTDEIKVDDFIEDIHDIQKDILTQQNIYSLNDAIAEASLDSDSNSCKYRIDSTSYPYYTNNSRVEDENGNLVTADDGDFLYEESTRNYSGGSWHGSWDSGGCNGDSDPVTGACLGSIEEAHCSNEGDDEARAEQKEAREDANAALKEIERLQEDLEEKFVEYATCSSLSTEGWRTIFELSPEITYEYDEIYDEIDDFENSRDADKMVLVDVDYSTGMDYYDDADAWYCTGSVNNDYDNCSGSESYETIDFKSIDCSDGDCSYDERTDIPIINFVKQEVTKTMKYDTPEVFYQTAASGNIIYSENGKIDNEDIQTELVDGLPISLDTDTGLHKFTFTIDDLGEYYDTCEAGRLIDADTNKSNSVEDHLNDSDEFKGEYTCYYDIIPECVDDPDTPEDECCVDDPNTPEDECDPEEDCPECEFECEDDPSTPEDECGITGKPDPEEECPWCLFIMDFPQIYYRNVSTSGGEDMFNPNDRPLGYNWNYEYDVNHPTYGYISGKAYATLFRDDEGILALGDTIYAQEPILSVKLTPGLASEIISYNSLDSVSSKGGYANDTLTCYDYSVNGAVYENIFCYSDFFDDLLTDYSDEIVFSNRPSETARGNLTSTSFNNDSYWEVYSGFNSFVVTETSIGGPSWR